MTHEELKEPMKMWGLDRIEFNIVDIIHKAKNNHFELFSVQHQEIDETLRQSGYIDGTEYSKAALTHCGTKSYYKKQDGGSVMRIDVATYSNICGYCHRQTDELIDVQDYIPHVICNQCSTKINTNEIKLTYLNFGEFLLNPTRDNPCDYPLARIVFQQWLSNNQGIDPKVVPIQYYFPGGKWYIREDVYKPEAELDWFRQKKARGEA